MDDEELEDEGVECDFTSSRWSWWAFLTDLFVMFTGMAQGLSELLASCSAQFAHRHNLKIDMDDQRDVAEDVMATIHQLPTKE